MDEVRKLILTLLISYYYLETKNFEPVNQEMGIGFHLDQPETSVYPLPPRETVIIPLSVISSMWGEYSDLLQLQVNHFFFSFFKF
jgi:hypothetical protein